MVQLSYLYMTTGKITCLTVRTFVYKVICLLFNTLSSFVIAFLTRSKQTALREGYLRKYKTHMYIVYKIAIRNKKLKVFVHSHKGFLLEMKLFIFSGASAMGWVLFRGVKC